MNEELSFDDLEGAAGGIVVATAIKKILRIEYILL